jgi:hypothetical protein
VNSTHTSLILILKYYVITIYFFNNILTLKNIKIRTTLTFENKLIKIYSYEQFFFFFLVPFARVVFLQGTRGLTWVTGPVAHGNGITAVDGRTVAIASLSTF